MSFWLVYFLVFELELPLALLPLLTVFSVLLPTFVLTPADFLGGGVLLVALVVVVVLVVLVVDAFLLAAFFPFFALTAAFVADLVATLAAALAAGFVAAIDASLVAVKG